MNIAEVDQTYQRSQSQKRSVFLIEHTNKYMVGEDDLQGLLSRLAKSNKKPTWTQNRNEKIMFSTVAYCVCQRANDFCYTTKHKRRRVNRVCCISPQSIMRWFLMIVPLRKFRLKNSSGCSNGMYSSCKTGFRYQAELYSSIMDYLKYNAKSKYA